MSWVGPHVIAPMRAEDNVSVAMKAMSNADQQRFNTLKISPYRPALELAVVGFSVMTFDSLHIGHKLGSMTGSVLSFHPAAFLTGSWRYR
jgi:hypothetical protein